MAYRYYVGLQLPPGISATIAGVQQALFDAELMISPLEPHITLLPPPAVENIDPKELIIKLKTAIDPYLPLALSLTDVTSSRNSIRITVASNKLQRMRLEMSALLPPHRSITGPFIPHITLAQVKREKRLPSHLLPAYREQLAALLPSSVIVPQVTFFYWQGPRNYTAKIIE